MRKRPRSSVTTSLANFVGRSFVSAITQTPASGPLGPVTVPLMSLVPLPGPPWVLRHAFRSAARAVAAMPRYKVFFVFMNPPLDATEPAMLIGTRRALELKLSGHQDAPFRLHRQAGSGSRQTGMAERATTLSARISCPPVQCARAQPRALDDRILRRGLFHQALPG